MNLSDIITMAREYVDEPPSEAADYSDANLLMFINSEHKNMFSKVRQTYEDWFGRETITQFTTNTLKYHLPLDVFMIRRVEVLPSGVSGTYPNLSYDELNGEKYLVDEISLDDQGQIYDLSQRGVIGNAEAYYIYENTINFTNGTDTSSSRHFRIYYIPTAPNLHKATAITGSSNSITLGVSGAATTLGTVSPTNNYYSGMNIEIISGTGAGQLNKIIQYVGSTRIATVAFNWNTTPDATSVYSINSPIPDDFHELLAYGASIRAKAKTEDDIMVLAQLYSPLLEDMKQSMESRNTQKSRRVISTWE